MMDSKLDCLSKFLSLFKMYLNFDYNVFGIDL